VGGGVGVVGGGGGAGVGAGVGAGAGWNPFPVVVCDVVAGAGEFEYPPEEDVEYPPLIAYCRWWYVQCGESCATGNSLGKRAWSAARSMKSFQIVAGNVGPETAIPCTEVMGISPRG